MDPDAPDNQTAMYCNRYPSVEGRIFPAGALRIGAHTDFELLTLLFTRPGLLHMLNRFQSASSTISFSEVATLHHYAKLTFELLSLLFICPHSCASCAEWSSLGQF